jgi:hypothetical protein
MEWSLFAIVIEQERLTLEASGVSPRLAWVATPVYSGPSVIKYKKTIANKDHPTLG